ncbi:MAG: SRPBCC family protein [Myxococcota bacterium]
MAMTVHGAAPIPLSREACWTRFLDLTRAKDYVPGLTDTVITTEQKQGVGASRIVSHAQFGDMNETVVQWDEGVGMTIRLHKGDRPATPFKEAHFRYEFRDAATPDACEIHCSMTYTLPGGALGRLADALFLRRVFARNVLDSAVCLAENYRTDAPVDHTKLPELRKNAL